MVNSRTLVIALGIVVATGTAASAASVAGKYHITEAEKAACYGDAASLCMSAYPNEDLLLACMRQNVVNLSEGCRPVFLRGLAIRHLD